MAEDISKDVNLIRSIRAVPSILEVVCQATGMGFATIARVTDDRWVAGEVRDEINFGLRPGGELEVATTICDEIRDHRSPVVIDDVDSDPVYCNHHTPRIYGLKSYISMPIILADGSFFGTLCAISPSPAEVSQPKIIGMFRLFAEMIANQIDASRSVQASNTALLDEQQASALREQFIAVLGHDLRNPLASIASGLRMLGKETLSARGTQVVELMDGSVVRASALIDNVLDFARGRLGGGITLDRNADEPLEPVLRQVVSELRSIAPGHTIAATYELVEPIDCDRLRLGQLLSNLLGNALTHGAADEPVRIQASSAGGRLVVAVRNGGPPIPPQVREHLFEPFFREDDRVRQGLGLGLHIASEIAQAHGGTLEVRSDEAETAFVFSMPLTDL